MAATSTNVPKQLLQDYMPGLGDQVVVGAQGLGTTIQYASLTANTLSTVLHSLKATPSFVVAQVVGNLAGDVTVNFVSADTSASYIRVNTGSGAGVVPVRIMVIR